MSSGFSVLDKFFDKFARSKDLHAFERVEVYHCHFVFILIITSSSLIRLPGFQGARGHGNNVAQLEAPCPQIHAGASKWRKASMMIGQNHQNSSHKVVGGIESRQQNTDRGTQKG